MEFRYFSHHPMADFRGAMDQQMDDPDVAGPAIESIKDIGMSVPLGISAQNVAGIYSKIRMGSGSLEIQFPGKFMGNRNGQTPGMYGEDQRQALRELANINEVNLTTHAAFSIMGLMGRDERGNFSVNSATEEMREIQRAIHFAADTAGGGSVVVHTGEWDRPLTDMVLDDENGRVNLGWGHDGRNLFRKRDAEVHDANFVLMDDRDSRLFDQVTKDKRVAYPEWKKAIKSEKGFDQDGNPTFIKKGDYINYEGRKIREENIYDPVRGRVPEFSEEEQRFKTRYMHYRDFEEEAQEYNRWAQKNWRLIAKEKGYKTKAEFDKNWYYDKMYPEEAYVRATLESNEGYSRGWALQFSSGMKDQIETLDKLRKAKDYYSELDASMPEDEKWKIMKSTGGIGDIVPGEVKNPVEVIDNLIKQSEARLEYDRLSGHTQEQQAQDTAETKEHLITPIKRFEKVTTGLYAQAAITAIDRTTDPNNPLTLAIENLFPERFGGHPTELRWIIDKVRERVVEYLTADELPLGALQHQPTNEDPGAMAPNPWKREGISKEQAKEMATKHVTATFDTGHLNIWRKYWVPQPGASSEDNERAFNEWYLDEVTKLAEGGYIGNVHLADNMGFWDDHLSPGQGNAPIKQAMEIIKKNGYDKAITVEPGADASTDQSDFHGLMKTWNYMGSGVYGLGMNTAGGMSQNPQGWADIHGSYFGQTQSPSYIFGSYAPSNDWTLWSQVPLE